MALRSRQKLWHKVAFSWVTLAILFLLSLLLSKSVLGMYHKNTLSQKRAETALTELEKVEARELSLNKSLEYVKTSRGVEEELRRKFDVAREGEHLLVIVDKEVEPEGRKKDTSWIGSLWSKFVQ